jgi:hypothetical protein
LKNFLRVGLFLGVSCVAAAPAAANSLIHEAMGHRSVVTIALDGSHDCPYYAGETK